MVSGTLTKVATTTSATHLLIDGSGSMNSRWASTIDNVNEFVGAQQNDNPGSTIIITVFGGAGKYSTAYNGPVEDAPRFTAQSMPNLNSMTALLDATVKALNDLKATGAERRQLASITDGGENDSTDYRGKHEVVKAMLETARAEGIDVVALAVGEAAWGNDAVYGSSNTIRAAASGAAYASGMSFLSARSLAYNTADNAQAFASTVATVASIDEDGTVKP